MTPERLRQIRNLFEAALERGASERLVFLGQACQGDDELGREIERLLVAHEHAADFMNGPLLGPVELDKGAALPRMEGRRLGAYLVLREIGHGGMGTVYLASRDDDVVHQQVAIKIVRGGVCEADVLRRFRQERDILASLDHPAIARLIDGGSTEEGLPYFVMDYIDGEPIDTWCDRHKLNVTERLKLFCAVCSGVQYAHQRLVVHRDLKPANILVTPEGNVKLLDFGIAKLLDSEGTPEDQAGTETLTSRMTPEYASPEQIRCEAVNTVSDIYALGVVLYELLTGRSPYTMRSRVMHEVARVICEEEPTRPSAAITEVDDVKEMTAATKPATISEVREGSPVRLRHRLEGDLDNILLKALQKGPSRRYSSADQFSEDVRKHLEGMPVSARKDTVWYRAGKFMGRHQVGLAAAVLILASLLFGLTTTLWQTRLALQQLRDANALAEETRQPKTAVRGQKQIAGQSPNGTPAPVTDTTGVLTPELVQFTFIIWILLGTAVFFTRANIRRLSGALAGGVLFMLVFKVEEMLPQSSGLRHFTWTITPGALPLLYAGIIPYGAAAALIGWRITRRFGWRGQLAFLAIACIGGPMRDYLWTNVIPLPGVESVPGFLPWIANGLFWLCAVGSGQAIMRLIAGPAKNDCLTRISWKL
jgi:serine/threonine protein kinase